MLSTRISRDFLKRVPIRQMLSRAKPLLPASCMGIKWVPEALQNWKPCWSQKKNFSSASSQSPNVLPRVEAGRYEGVLNNPADEVFHTLNNFYDLSWTGLDIQVDKVGIVEVLAYLKEHNPTQGEMNLLEMAEKLLKIKLNLKNLFEEVKNLEKQKMQEELKKQELLKRISKLDALEQDYELKKLEKLETQKKLKMIEKLQALEKQENLPLMRRIRYPREGIYNSKGEKTYHMDFIDIMLPSEGHELKYLVLVNKISLVNQNLTGLLRDSMMVVTQSLQDLGNRQCRYTMKTEVSAPYTSVKLLNAPLDQLNGIYYKGLFKKFNLEDVAISLDDLPLKISKVVDFMDFQVDNAHGKTPVGFSPTEQGVIVASKMPDARYGLNQEKLVTLASKLAGIPIEKIFNTFVNDTMTATMTVKAMEAKQPPPPSDPWVAMYRATTPGETPDPDAQFLSDDLYGLKRPNYITKDNNFMNDEIFAEYFFNGGNPFNVSKASDLKSVPHIAEFQSHLKGENLQKLVSSGNLFYLDYALLNDIKYPHVANNMVTHAPTVLLKREGSTYHPLGIYVEAPFNTGARKRVFTPKDNPNVWRLAKMHVNVSDLLFYQIYVHLGKAHLMSEPLAVSIYNNLIALHRGPDPTKEKQPNILGKVLAPYAYGLLGINHLGLITIVDDKQALIDSVFAGGASSLLKLTKTKIQEDYSLKGMNPHEDLKSRGFDLKDCGSKDYAYAYYSVRLYDIIKQYMVNVSKFIYKDDKAVQSDVDLQNLEQQLHDLQFNLGMKLDSIENVAELAACHMWTLTAYHSISFSIQDYDSYIPFRFSGLTKPLPMDESKDKEVDNTYVQEALPFSTKQLINHMLLGAVGTRMETTLLETANPFNQTKQPELYKNYEAFKEDLQKFEDDYCKDMEELKKKGRMQFYYLKPSFIENCLAI